MSLLLRWHCQNLRLNKSQQGASIRVVKRIVEYCALFCCLSLSIFVLLIPERKVPQGELPPTTETETTEAELGVVAESVDAAAIAPTPVAVAVAVPAPVPRVANPAEPAEPSVISGKSPDLEPTEQVPVIAHRSFSKAPPSIVRDPPLPPATQRHLDAIALNRAAKALEAEKKKAELARLEKLEAASRPARDAAAMASAESARHRGELRRLREQFESQAEEILQEQRRAAENARAAEQEAALAQGKREKLQQEQLQQVQLLLLEKFPPVQFSNASPQTEREVREIIEQNRQAAEKILRSRGR